MKTQLLIAGWIGVLSMALVSAQSSTPVRTASPVATAPAAASRVPADPAAQRATVNQFCVPCHNARLKTANLLLGETDLTKLGEHPDLGEKVVRKLRDRKSVV